METLFIIAAWATIIGAAATVIMLIHHLFVKPRGQ